MTRVPANLSPSLLKLNPHLAEKPARVNALDVQRLAACPPSQRERLVTELTARQQHAAQGAAAHASGASLEAWLNDQHANAMAHGYADVEHTNPPFKVTGDLGGGQKKGFFESRSGPDYRGVLRGGRGFAVEAKNAGRGRLELFEPPEGDPRRERFDGLKEHQRDALERCEQLGGVALLVVRLRRRSAGRDVETTYVIPWNVVRDLDSLGPDDVRGHEAREGCYLRPYAERAE